MRQLGDRDLVELMHYLTGKLAGLLLGLPVGKCRRSILSAMGEQAGTDWLEQVERYQQLVSQTKTQIADQVVRGSLGLK